MENMNGIPADSQSSIDEIPLNHLQRAGRLLAALAALQRNQDLCDILVQTENQAENETENAVENGSDGEEGEAVGEATGEAVGESTGEAVGETTAEVVSETPTEATSEATTGATNETTDRSRGIWAHRAILAAGSQVFNTMLLDISGERSRPLVVPGISSESLLAIVAYIYSPDSLILTEENAPVLAVAASQMDVRGMRDMACNYLVYALSSQNAISTLTFARLHDYSDLITSTLKYIEDNAESILADDQILYLTPEEMNTLLAMDGLAAREECTLNALLRWTIHSPEERQEHLYELLLKVKLQQVPQEVLAEVVRAKPLTTAEPRALQLVINVLKPQPERSNHSQAAKNRSESTEPGMQYIWLLAGGKTDHDCTDTVLKCLPPKGTWESVAPLPEPRSSAGAAVLGSFVYVIGGDDGKSAKNIVYVYNVTTDSWTTGPEMPTARFWLGAAALEGRLYAVGGLASHGTGSLNSVEALDPREPTWRAVASMGERRHALGVAAMDGKLYAVGGLNDKSALNSVERYDPVADSWTHIESMKVHRACVSVSVLDDSLYAVGGCTRRHHIHRSVERYRSDSGWETISPMSLIRRAASVISHGGELYVAGGFYSRSEYTKTVTRLNPSTERWTELPDLPGKRTAAAAVVVPWTSRRDPN